MWRDCNATEIKPGNNISSSIINALSPEVIITNSLGEQIINSKQVRSLTVYDFVFILIQMDADSVITVVPVPHDDVIEWKHVPRYWPLVRGIDQSPVNSPRKDQWRGALMFPLICAWMNGWLNTRETGDLRRHRAHHDVIVMEQYSIYHVWHGCLTFFGYRTHWFKSPRKLALARYWNLDPWRGDMNAPRRQTATNLTDFKTVRRSVNSSAYWVQNVLQAADVTHA